MPMTKSALSRQSLNLIQSPIPWLQAFWKFSRPHTIAGTSLSVVGLFAMAWVARYPELYPGTFHVWQGVSSLWITWLACLCANLYIVGLNQVEDVAADRVNKPYLPVASGAFSAPQAKMLVGIAGSGAVLLAVLSQGMYLVMTVGLSVLVGTAYSLPPLQLKRFALLGSCCKLLVRGPVVNLGIFLHASSQLGLVPQIPGRVWGLMVVVVVFSGAIALLKALRDQTIDTLSAPITRRLVWWMLTVCYGGLIAAAPFIPGINTPFLMATHGLALLYFWYLSYQGQASPDKTELAHVGPGELYQFIWQLFFIEYLIFPTACLLAQV